MMANEHPKSHMQERRENLFKTDLKAYIISAVTGQKIWKHDKGSIFMTTIKTVVTIISLKHGSQTPGPQPNIGPWPIWNRAGNGR